MKKPQISLLQLHNAPEGYLHSKISFLKSILNQQNPEMQSMKEQMYKLTYTIKNIGVKGDEIGITSKRTLLRPKEIIKMVDNNLDDNLQKVLKKKYLPRNSFFAEPLVPIRKSKVKEQNTNMQENNFLIVTPSINQTSLQKSNLFTFSHKMLESHSKSASLLKRHSFAGRSLNLKQKEFREKVSSQMKNSEIISKNNNKIEQTKIKKSFAKLLGQCRTVSLGNLRKKSQGKNQQKQLIPLQHQESPLFKKIKKIQEHNIRNPDNFVQSQSHRYHVPEQKSRK